jgi:hypothetical protein
MLNPRGDYDDSVSNGGPTRIDKLVEQFVAVRDRIEEIEDIHKEQLAPYIKVRDKLIGTLLKLLDSTGQTSARTAVGTASIKTTYTAPLADPDAFMEYVAENAAFELMDRRANQAACRDFAEQHGSLPPGVKINSFRTVTIRSPS